MYDPGGLKSPGSAADAGHERIVKDGDLRNREVPSESASVSRGCGRFNARGGGSRPRGGGEVVMKAKLYRLALAVSMLAIAVEALGAPRKW